MFKDNTFLPELNIYACPLFESCKVEILHNGYDLMFHLVESHELSKDHDFLEERNKFQKQMPKNMMIMGSGKILNAILMASLLGQKTLAEYIMKKHAKEFGVIKNVSN